MVDTGLLELHSPAHQHSDALHQCECCKQNQGELPLAVRICISPSAGFLCTSKCGMNSSVIPHQRAVMPYSAIMSIVVVRMAMRSRLPEICVTWVSKD